jgi:hypothetical protein
VRRDWFSRAILWLTAVVLGLVLMVIAAAYLPGWWANRIADVVDGNRIAGVLGGLACGVVFSVLPLQVLRSAVRPRRRFRARLALLLDVVLLALPIMLTLGVVVGGGPDGEAARMVLDTRGSGFGAATLGGVVIGVALVVASWVLLAGRRRRLHELDDLRTRLELRDTKATRNGPAEGGHRAGRPDGAT